MSLDLSKLEKVVDLSGGTTRARCPACAESGSDKTGVHLRIYADGRFGCCVHPKDKEHRKRIFALAGERDVRSKEVRRGIVVKVAAATTDRPVKAGLLQQIALGFDAEASETVRTPRTVEAESKVEVMGEGRTVRTCNQDSLYGAQKIEENSTKIKKGFCKAVRSVRSSQAANDLPYLKVDGTLVIPTDAPNRYHWWAGGQSVDETIAEIRERMEKDASPF